MTKEKAKSKPKRAPSRFSWRKILLIGSAIFVVYIIYLILMPLATYPAIITQTSLPDDLHPLAEEVFSTIPIRESIRVTDDLSLRLNYWKGGFQTNSTYSICINLYGVREASYQRLSHIFVNGEKVSGITYGLEMGGLSNSTSYTRCAEGDLEAGLHLIEFHLRDSAWGEPVAIQRWAIEIE